MCTKKKVSLNPFRPGITDSWMMMVNAELISAEYVKYAHQKPVSHLSASTYCWEQDVHLTAVNSCQSHKQIKKQVLTESLR